MFLRSLVLSLLSLPALVAAVEPVSFNRDIRPIMSDTCFHCHGFDPKSREAGLRLDVREDAIKETSEGTIGIVPGDPDKSAIIQRLFDDEDPMPPKKSHKTLTAEQKELFRRWVAEGAVYEKHWAFVPPKTPDSGFLNPDSNPIDQFIQQRLAKEGLKPSPRADAATLIRRVSLDLTGLPPSSEDLAMASGELTSQQYDKIVSGLLGSKHYGERWGRWWLDQARYADSNGYSIDAPRQMWKYRDWVIEALNKDMPFDRFTIEQLAGDLLPKATESQKIATGFHRNTQINEEGGIDKEQFRIESVFDRVATTGTVWLGLTIGCAQCHDHKFDPIEHKEYYQFFAFLNSQEEPVMKVTDPKVDVVGLKAQFKELNSRLQTLVTARHGELDEWEKGMKADYRRKLSSNIRKILAKSANKRSLADDLDLFALIAEPGDELLVLIDRRKELDNKLNKGPTTLVMQELAKPRKTNIFIKGDFTRPDAEVTPGTPKVLHALPVAKGRQPNRLDLAKWIMSPENPLTARVIVNRVWQQYFGRGIVETDNDFGSQGTPPSHPELLDWLAMEFVKQKWSLKALHRIIVTSQTYQQSSANRPDLREKDPQNYLLGRQTRLRLDAEIVRDVCLSSSGLLSEKIGGPSVFPPIPDG
ncbi:PSD1 and planctomycete cytochrome C domain-containing protein, partial [Brevifollis gellanilyticus]|uniref:PSD1 and planctomycete cytochrome C domain-containing protein n=1 Tax=Brevifollis gellanilyticus TaxID=748831 RepID=UPI0011BF6E0A